MVYLVPERENIFPTDAMLSSNLSADLKADTATNGSSYASPKVGSFQTSNTTKSNQTTNDIKEDEVDVQLDKLDGRIPRKRDPQL